MPEEKTKLYVPAGVTILSSPSDSTLAGIGPLFTAAYTGHLELDTVSHCGGNAEGLFAYSFNLTDIGSTWVETRSVLGKGEVGIVKAFSEMSEVLPFKVLDIDSDNVLSLESSSFSG